MNVVLCQIVILFVAELHYILFDIKISNFQSLYKCWYVLKTNYTSFSHYRCEDLHIDLMFGALIVCMCVQYTHVQETEMDSVSIKLYVF